MLYLCYKVLIVMWYYWSLLGEVLNYFFIYEIGCGGKDVFGNV